MSTSAGLIESGPLDGTTEETVASSPSGSITMPILCEDGNSSSTCATTAGTKAREVDLPEKEKREAGGVVTVAHAAKVSDHSVDLDPSYQPARTQTTRTDDSTSMSFQNWQQQRSVNSGQARVDKFENVGEGNLALGCVALGISDDSGEVGTSVGASAKADSAAGLAADQSIMSSIASSVQWHENPLGGVTSDSMMSADEARIAMPQPPVGTSSSLMTVVINPLATGSVQVTGSEHDG